MANGTCMFCGGPCFHRVDGHDDCAYDFMRDLGLAIARFVRNARVAELTQAIEDETARYAVAVAEHLPNTRREAWGRHAAALTELARLARDGGGR